MFRFVTRGLFILVIVGLAACGGGSSVSGPSTPPDTTPPPPPPTGSTTVIGEEAKVELVDTQRFARWTQFRPTDGKTVELNPPRFSWPYDPNIVPAAVAVPAGRLFTLQISTVGDFSSVDFEVADTPYNFFNFIPGLDSGQTWFWRVGYDVGTTSEFWSDARQFQISASATDWPRDHFVSTLDQFKGHPRVLFNSQNLVDIQNLENADANSATFMGAIRAAADAAILGTVYQSFPADDCPPGTDPSETTCQADWFFISQSMLGVAFMHQMTGDAKYANALDHFLTIATFPPGGRSSPEDLNGLNGVKWSSHITDHLGLIYDWYYNDLDPGERTQLRGAIEWRLEHMLHNFIWTTLDGNGDSFVGAASLAAVGWSHEYQNLMACVSAALAIYDESAIARETLEFALHYLAGVTNPYGEDAGWNEGPGYGNGKMRYLMDTTVAIHTVFPELNMNRNPQYDRYMEFFSSVLPMGAHHSSFGNRGHIEGDWARTRRENAYRVALLSQNAKAMASFVESEKALNAVNLDPNGLIFSPWVSYVLPAYFSTPTVDLTPPENSAAMNEGWVTVSSASPNDYDAQQSAVGMTFQSRPRGGYGHSFSSDNAFDIYAYGETIATGGGTTANDLEFPRHTASHNTVLIDGNRQTRSVKGDYRNDNPQGRSADIERPTRARIVSYQEGTFTSAADGNDVSYVYWAGDATNAYELDIGLERFIRHVVFVDNAYFVIYDDISLQAGREAVGFQWLYHVTPATTTPLTIDQQGGFNYKIGDVNVDVRHVIGEDLLDFQDYISENGQLNIATCGTSPAPGMCAEDYRNETTTSNGGSIVDAHHIWVTTMQPSTERNFLATIVPYLDSDDAPRISSRANKEVTISFRERDITIGFDSALTSDLVIDAECIATVQGC